MMDPACSTILLQTSHSHQGTTGQYTSKNLPLRARLGCCKRSESRGVCLVCGALQIVVVDLQECCFEPAALAVLNVYVVRQQQVITAWCPSIEHPLAAFRHIACTTRCSTLRRETDKDPTRLPVLLLHAADELCSKSYHSSRVTLLRTVDLSAFRIYSLTRACSGVCSHFVQT